MHSILRKRFCLAVVFLSMVPLQAQEFKLFDRSVQVHGFASQGFIHTDDNNWLTMNTTNVGSGEFTDFGANISTQITDNFRIGAQVYDRNLGALGKWHPSLDWAYAQYKFKPWLGVRGGRVKTTAGLFTDTQDLDFLRPFALLPQSVYPTDLRDSTIAHNGMDVYGNIPLGGKRGTLGYTVFAGGRNDSLYSGYPYLLSQYEKVKSYGGLQYGADLRWETPVKGLLVGASRIDEDITARAIITVPAGPAFIQVPLAVPSKKEWSNYFYGQYTHNRLELASEFKRFYSLVEVPTVGMLFQDNRGWYVSGAYRVNKLLQLGSYYSHYTVRSASGGTDTDLPSNHIYDKAIVGRVDLNRYWNIKVEGHFMDGTGIGGVYPAGFYPQQNLNGFQPNTNALVVKTGVNF